MMNMLSTLWKAKKMVTANTAIVLNQLPDMIRPYLPFIAILSTALLIRTVQGANISDNPKCQAIFDEITPPDVTAQVALMNKLIEFGCRMTADGLTYAFGNQGECIVNDGCIRITEANIPRSR